MHTVGRIIWENYFKLFRGLKLQQLCGFVILTYCKSYDGFDVGLARLKVSENCSEKILMLILD